MAAVNGSPSFDYDAAAQSIRTRLTRVHGLRHDLRLVLEVELEAEDYYAADAAEVLLDRIGEDYPHVNLRVIWRGQRPTRLPVGP